MQWEKYSLFNKWYWKNWTATCRRINLEYFLTTYTKINSKIKGINVRLETIKILEENTGNNFSNIGPSNIFLDTSPGARVTKAKINYWDYIKITNFCIEK